MFERLARYESILQQNGLLNAEISTVEETHLGIRHRVSGLERQKPYNVGEHEIQHMSDDEDEDDIAFGDIRIAGRVTPDPLTGVFIGLPQSLLRYHLSHRDAMFLWNTHIENVEPLCKVVHIPSTGKMIDLVSQRPGMSSKPNDCVLSAIYNAAVF
ncbi:hypothetical protein PENANT_c005G06035 [Penicillium antarcticum]|uniref:Uncharacterized protein n=1 Tax=Penicillium antarcticum TaxID=416450 RepID=A0A1V6QFN3_9EURO|nr:hypothetical protein PENANT_c005G06035 [Penicillium antarcticum]